MKQKTAMMEFIDMLESDAKEYELDNVTIYAVINLYKKQATKLLEKEKEQIINAFDAGDSSYDYWEFTKEDYYNETYKHEHK